MHLKDFYYELPQGLIAQSPAQKRDMSRLLVMDRKTGQTAHHHFYDLKNYLVPGDCLVINNTGSFPRGFWEKGRTPGAGLNLCC